MENTSNKNLPWMISTFLLLGLIIGFGASQIPAVQKMLGTTPSVQTAVTPPPAEPRLVSKKLSAEEIAVLEDSDPVFGTATSDVQAPITIVEFSDFQCPYCAGFALESFPGIKENYIDTGKVKMVYRDFPLENIHPQAALAANASECANEQGLFEKMHDELFIGQQEWSANPDYVKVFQGYAKKIGAKTTQFNACMTDKKYIDEVRKDTIDGSSYGVNSTPSFFVNGKLVEGALPFEKYFKPLLEAELAGKQWDMYEEAATGRPYLVIEGKRIN